jgi:hypothetical protein
MKRKDLLLTHVIEQNPGANAPQEMNETNDCVVRAISNGFRIDYKVIHAFCKAMGRTERQGTATFHLVPCLNMIEVKEMKGKKLTDVILYSGVFNETYIIDTMTHWFCVRSGVILDWRHTRNEKVWRVFKIVIDKG